MNLLPNEKLYSISVEFLAHHSLSI